MATQAEQRTTVAGTFTDREDAAAAIRELQEHGFTDEHIGYAIRDGGVSAAGSDLAAGAVVEETAGGAATGALTGGLLGGLIGAAAALLLPGIGPIVAGGILASALGGAAIGATAGGLLGALTGMGVPEDEAAYYESEFQAGRAVVTVRAEGRAEEAAAILSRHGARGMPPGTTDEIASQAHIAQSSGAEPRQPG